VADDYVAWRRFVCSLLREAGWRVVGEVSDGLEAIQKAQELQPDVILMDIELPNLNGIEAARQICELEPRSKILFLSITDSADIVTKALKAGARGYIVKYDAASELLPAVQAVFQGDRFIGSTLRGLIPPDR
jgi:DNA-binding NarL/FixJ family response regulator